MKQTFCDNLVTSSILQLTDFHYLKNNFKTMKEIFGLLALLIVVGGNAQTSPAPKTTFAKSLGMYVFPAKNQNTATQEKDDTDCYKWAVEQSGVDPMNPTKV